MRTKLASWLCQIVVVLARWHPKTKTGERRSFRLTRRSFSRARWPRAEERAGALPGGAWTGKGERCCPGFGGSVFVLWVLVNWGPVFLRGNS